MKEGEKSPSPASTRRDIFMDVRALPSFILWKVQRSFGVTKGGTLISPHGEGFEQEYW
jgi:hypothetical protein